MRFSASFPRLLLLVCLAAASWSSASLAQEAPLPFSFELQDASPLELYDSELDSSDSNTPVLWAHGRIYAFVSHYLPIGHSYRRSGTALDSLEAGAIPVEIKRDQTPQVGKWVEATYREPDGTLYGWYHAETDGPCDRGDAKIPIIGAAVSHNDGLTWDDLGPVMEAPKDAYNCDMQNGFFAGGLGDFSVIREKGYFYFLFSNYDRHRSEQGISIARMPYEARMNPRGQVWKWRDGNWDGPGLGGHTTPIFAAVRNFRHADPDSYWGPAIHYNTYLGGYVMLLNRTAEGNSDWWQEGIYLTFSKDLSDPESWSEPEKLMEGGDWYPEIIGTAPGETDTLAGQQARFFMSGYSAWEIEFHKHAANAHAGVPAGETSVQ
jgi:hypothetical protein